MIFTIFRFFKEKKENPQLGSKSRVIKNYYIKSEAELKGKYDEIKKLCELFNARASFRLNKRSFEKVGFKCLENLANTMMNRNYFSLMKSYDRACGLLSNEKENKWIVDIDGDIPRRKLNDLIKHIEEKCNPIGDKYIQVIPSKSGLHLITRPFDKQQFGISYPSIEIQKDNPTNLFIP